MKTSLVPFEVAEYSPDFITNVIRYITGWTSRGEVLDKHHIAYLKNYLLTLGVKTVVFESDYVDRNYIEDYAEYYARCFQYLPKTCARLHFFTSEFAENELATALNNVDNNFINNKIKGADCYVGFVVVRPLPVTCIARMSLAPYKLGEKAVFLKEEVRVSFFGIDLSLNTAAFIEQDKVVSACATSAIWSLLNASKIFRADFLPSPSAITKSALIGDSNGIRTFPAAAGLRTDHVCRSLKTYGLEPTVIDFADYEDEHYVNNVKNILAAYLPSNIPVLIGGSVAQINADGELEFLGDHLICALGYKSTQVKECTLPEKDINRVYVHDDRYGPYVSLEDYSDGKSFKFQLLQNEGNESKVLREEIFTPKVLIIGLNQKIRIDYEYAYNVAAAILELVQNIIDLEDFKESKDFSNFAACKFRADLCHSTELKKEFLSANTNFYSFNGTSEPSAFLTANMPKYIWRCRYIHDGALFADILIDATGVPQGDLVIGCIAYSANADICWRGLSKLVPTEYYRQITTGLEHNVSSVIGCITRFFLSFGSNYLDAYYGPLRVPARKNRSTEVDGVGEQVKRVDIVRIVRGSNASEQINKLKKNNPQIWVIDQFGDLIIGDEPIAPGKMGHPALTGGGPARIGGELNYVNNDDVWEINTFSGTYSSHLKSDIKKASLYLDSVLKNNLDGCAVRKQKSIYTE